MFTSRLFATKRSLVQMKSLNAMQMQMNQARYFATIKKFTKTHEWIEFDDES